MSPGSLYGFLRFSTFTERHSLLDAADTSQDEHLKAGEIIMKIFVFHGSLTGLRGLSVHDSSSGLVVREDESIRDDNVLFPPSREDDGLGNIVARQWLAASLRGRISNSSV